MLSSRQLQSLPRELFHLTPPMPAASVIYQSPVDGHLRVANLCCIRCDSRKVPAVAIGEVSSCVNPLACCLDDRRVQGRARWKSAIKDEEGGMVFHVGGICLHFLDA